MPSLLQTYGLVKRGIESVHFPPAVKQEELLRLFQGISDRQANVLVRNLCHRNPEAPQTIPKRIRLYCKLSMFADII